MWHDEAEDGEGRGTNGHGLTHSTSFLPCSPYGKVTLTASKETSSSGVPHSSSNVLITPGSLLMSPRAAGVMDTSIVNGTHHLIRQIQSSCAQAIHQQCILVHITTPPLTFRLCRLATPPAHPQGHYNGLMDLQYRLYNPPL